MVDAAEWGDVVVAVVTAAAAAAATTAAAPTIVDEDRFVGSIMSMGSVGLRGLVSASREATLKLLRRELDLCIC